MALGHLDWAAARVAVAIEHGGHRPGRARGGAAHPAAARAAAPTSVMTSVLTALSVLSTLVFSAMLVMLLAETLDAYRRRR